MAAMKTIVVKGEEIRTIKRNGKMKIAREFRKKPVIVEAVIWDGSADTANAFIGEGYGADWWYEGEGPRMVIPTLEGNHIADIGDYIIKGVKGEFYPCKPNIFALSYDPIL